ncbi:MAG: DUF1704 domain-containing protein [Candidatus Peregrinibacteria bacterium]|nr:DUF1704 domain-containing protein [Candidatus Peregrinibacteria bacterium]
MFPFLSSKGVLGLNARNLLYIKPFNPRKAVAFADDKIKTKAFLAARGIPTAKVYARIESRSQLKTFDFAALPDSCVLKPNYGSGGEGILILKGRKNGQYLLQGKTPISDKEMREHIEDILDGKFSVNGRMDTAFFEKILVPHEGFAPFRPLGLPDVRIVVFNLVPVMAMLRVPTAESGGKANVHLGGIGIGINMSKGVTTHAAQYNRIIRDLPHGGSPAGIPIPFWEEILLHSARIQQMTNIGYLAVDFTVDEEQGPVLLEVNARAGLMVQVANLAPLRARLKRVEGLPVSSPEKGVHLAQELFGEKVNRVEREVEIERPILGTREMIVIAGDGANMEVPCLISTDQAVTTFAPDLIEQLKTTGGIEDEEGKPGVNRVKFTLGGRKIQTVVRSGVMPSLSVRAMIGTRDLKDFLIDPKKEAPSSAIRSAVREDVRAIDRVLAQIDRALPILKFVRPVNLTEERAKAEGDSDRNPLFEYLPLPDDIDDMERRLALVSPDTSPLGLLLEKKRRELLARMHMLRARGDAVRFTEASQALFGAPTSVLIASALAQLKARVACDLPPPERELIDAEDAVPLFEEALMRYSLHDWQVSVKENLVSDCAVGGRKLFLRKGKRFSREHIAALVAHEIETHILTAENGAHQPFALFRGGFAHYLDTQEGLAIWNQNRVISANHEKRYGPARSVLGIAFALEHSFCETVRYLEDELHYDHEKAFGKAFELKRGLRDTAEPGGFTKGIVYFRGVRAIEQFVLSGGDLKRLYIGKIAVEDLEHAEKVPGVKPPLLLPVFLREQETR